MVPVLPNCAQALHSHIHIHILCFVLLVMGLGPRFMFSPLRAPHCVFCTFRCDLLFDFGPFFYSSLVLCGVFFLYSFIYLSRVLIWYNTHKQSLPSLPLFFSHHQHIKVPYYLPSPPYSSAQVFVVAFTLLTTY
jgi:hypothetical protein